MKIAVGISGIYRPRVGSVEKNIEQIQKKFDADMYYHTWDEYEKDIPPEYKMNSGTNFFTSPEPIVSYHPIYDPKPTNNRKHAWYIRTRDPRTKFKHSNKQIIGYCNLYDNIPKNYDLYIRTRWDVMINTKFNNFISFRSHINSKVIFFKPIT